MPLCMEWADRVGAKAGHMKFSSGARNRLGYSLLRWHSRMLSSLQSFDV